MRTLRIVIACAALLLAVATASVRLSMPDPPPLDPVASNISAAPDPISLGVRVPTDALEVQLHYLSLDPTSLGVTVRANRDGNEDRQLIEALRRRSQHILLSIWPCLDSMEALVPDKASRYGETTAKRRSQEMNKRLWNLFNGKLTSPWLHAPAG